MDIVDDAIDDAIDAELLAVNVYNRLGELLTDDNAWLAKLDLLRQFVEEHGRLPRWNAEYLGVKLGNWVNAQRQAKKGNGAWSMTPEREAALEAIPGWSWAPFDAAWQTNYDLLRQYFEEFWCLPSRNVEYQGVKLGNWVTAQRMAKKGTKGSATMTPEREAALEAIPGWIWEADPDAVWQVNCALLRRFVEEHARLPIATVEYQGVKLGSWVSVQRKAKKGQGSYVMTPEREAALEDIPGWVWEADLDAAWQANYDLLRQFVEEHARLPSVKAEYLGVKLGNWVSNQRQAKKGQSRGVMTPEREAALEAIPGWRW